jgi:ubiquinone/menaquinone biosynthesis C-methylase UbiE
MEGENAEIEEKSEKIVWEKHGENNPFYVTSNDRTPDKLLEMIPKSCSVLDAGCGWGRNSIALMEKGCDLVGVDFSLSLCKEAKKRGIQVVHGDLTRLPFKTHAFDCLISITVLLHIPTKQLPSVLKEFHRCSKVSIFNIQNSYNLGHMLKHILFMKQTRSVHDARALEEGWLVSCYSFKEVRSMLAKTFREVEIKEQEKTLYIDIPRTKAHIKVPCLLDKYAFWLLCVCR